MTQGDMGKDRTTVTVIPAASGFYWLSLYGDDEEPEVSRQNIIAWRIETTYSTARRDFCSFASPVGLEGLLDENNGAILSPDGRVTEAESADYPSIDKWVAAKKSERRTAKMTGPPP